MSDRQSILEYLGTLNQVAIEHIPDAVQTIFQELLSIEESGCRVFLCGNGGSGANALHIENDFSIGVSKVSKHKFSVENLGANSAVSTAISNDYSYEEVFSRQLEIKAKAGDLLIVFSGSGNSPNILKVLETSKRLGVRSCAVLGYDGGLAMTMADVAVHFPVKDMQISEDLQVILGHLVMRQFREKERME